MCSCARGLDYFLVLHLTLARTSALGSHPFTVLSFVLHPVSTQPRAANSSKRYILLLGVVAFGRCKSSAWGFADRVNRLLFATRRKIVNDRIEWALA
jgi:hypothetical protein